MNEETLDRILAIIDDVSDEHRLDEYECDLCGSHYNCYASECREIPGYSLGSDHTSEKVKEALKKEFVK